MIAAKPLILIDGSSYLHRAFHALPELATASGQPTGAIYGVINMLKKLIAEYKPEYIAVVFDAKGKNFRHELYPEYKATRPPMAEELKVQIKPLHEIIEAMGLKLLMIEGVEADDVIGTLAKEASKHQMAVVISTGDKDFAQIVNHNITLVNTMTDTKLDSAGVEKKFGVKPQQIVDYLALVGDASDNVKGVSMVGPKTAVKWLNEYGSLENLVKHADAIKGKVGENLRASLEQLPLATKLVTIKDDVSLPFKPHDLVCQAPDNKKLAELFTQLEFKTWLHNLTPNAMIAENHPSNYRVIFTEKDFAELLAELNNAPAFALDTETTSLDVMIAEIVGISFATKKGEGIYIPLGHDYAGAPQQLKRTHVLAQLKPLLENPALIKLGQNLKYDKNVLANYGINLQGIKFDTMLESYVLNNANNRHDKETLALKYLSKKVTTFEEVAGSGAKHIPFNQVAIESAAPYAASDADIVLQLHEVLWKELAGIPPLVQVFATIEMPLLSILARMERGGVCIDVPLLQKQSAELAARLTQLEQEVYTLAGQVFNLNSPLQLQEILFTKLNLPALQKTPKGQPSTAEPVLQELALEYPLPKLILEYRSLSKLKSTYADALPAAINPGTQRVHTSYNQAVTATGRLSSTNPNLQNIPIRTPEGRRIRQAFIAPHGYKIVTADYSQIELRIMAHLSQDAGLLQAFAEGDDVHKSTAAEIFGVALNEVTNEQRQRAKTINFGLIYGMSAFGLAKRLGLSRPTAQNFVDLYFARYPKVKRYMEEACVKAREQGFVETLFGRRIYLPNIRAKNFQLKAAAERAAINGPMQGSAADIIKLAMINVDHWLQHTKCDSKMIMQVHDELVFEIANSAVDCAISAIKSQMESAAQLSVPLIVHVGAGDNWDAAHKQQ